MLYDLSNPIQANTFLVRAKALAGKAGSVVELTERKPKTIAQNAYLHVCLAYYGAVLGYPLEYVKRVYFKKHCNEGILYKQWVDKRTGNVEEFYRSVADPNLTSAELTTCIERFRNWAASEEGGSIYIPEPNEEKYILEMQRVVEEHKEYI